ncbi:putative disease resistance RPP13-like protein 1 [Vigna unguiculata]|uniref:putative disease resistance RPP13-like protein 1 n=1 Tax=Vigna unguiculata TaxID=3917 RepID=UPI0010161E64|nr:putative disease resistance RPP13-like protein 1 [Vigna unguiculata]
MPALLLSYRHLPSNLKRCFAYCALFPKDYEFDKNELILLWIAQDFLHCSQQSNNLEDIGQQYFNDLLTRSFFLQSDLKTCFSMHDLLNDLAKYVCADFCFRLKFDKGNCIPKTTRQFSFAFWDVKYFDEFGSLTDAKRLRSFFPIKEIGRRYIGHYPLQFKILVHELFSNFKFLRVLSLDKYYELREVPDSIGDLKHLHSLDLSRTGIQKLPDSICLLYNLLILKLNYCSSLEELPLNLHKLTKLRCLEFKYTKVTKMPMHFGELKNLQVLNTIFFDRNNEFSTKHLGGLNLHGRLSINEVQNIVNPVDALEANMKNKDLVKLELKWKSDHIPDDPRKEKKVLENLQPSKNVEHLSIENYGGTEFPSWVFDNSLSNLVFLRLEDCKYCLCIPPLGLLSSLKTLEIVGLDGIVSIGAEFYGSSSSSFASLEKLKFLNMKELEEWEYMIGAFPRLQILRVCVCPKLKGMPEQLLHVKHLYISCSMITSSHKIVSHNSLEALNCCAFTIMNFPMSRSYDLLAKIEIIGSCDSLTTFPLDFFPNLKALLLVGCRNLQIISQKHTHNRLKHLSISGSSRFDSFPSEGLSAPRLQTIDIYGAEI